MPLLGGTHIGHYEILGPLGAGGMGEVYRAHDAKLNRDVAIKVLPARLANDADYLARFQREAHALAALHHPNIATIFGLEQNSIVMELVEGETLRGPLPLAHALPVLRWSGNGRPHHRVEIKLPWIRHWSIVNCAYRCGNPGILG